MDYFNVSEDGVRKTPIYITTTLPYINGRPHIGFAMEILRADAMARYFLMMGHDVFFNTGTDEHGTKIMTSAEKEGMSPREFADRNSGYFRQLLSDLGIWENVKFIRTTDDYHVEAAQEFWRRCDENGYIYKGIYKAKYCVGCELEVQDSDLVDGRCKWHPNREIEEIDEENYFFKFSEFERKLLDMYGENPNFVKPDFRFNELKAFVKRGLRDFSISRPKSKLPWGVPVPGDDEHVMYVWFDALANYVTTLGWPNEDEGSDFWKFWKKGFVIQYAGKDNLRQQAGMWQAMLMACGLPNSKQIVINGFVSGPDGRKMSKSLGNVVSIYEALDLVGREGFRYYILRHLSNFEDSPVSLDMIKEAYEASLANGLGNLASRVLALSSRNLGSLPDFSEGFEFDEEYVRFMGGFLIKDAMDYIWKEIGRLDAIISKEKPFEVVKSDKEKGEKMIEDLCLGLYGVARMLEPMMPETSEKILAGLAKNEKPESLFPRLEG